MPISRAGATYETGLTTSAVSTRMYASRLRTPTPMASHRWRPHAVPRGEGREIQSLQTHGDQDEDERWPAELWSRDDEDRDRERREDDRADHVREKQKRRVRAHALREQIPRRVKDGRYEDETESKETHARTLWRRTSGSRGEWGPATLRGRRRDPRDREARRTPP